MNFLISLAAGALIGIIVYWIATRGERQRNREPHSQIYSLRHAISEMSMHKYGPQR